MVPPPPRAGFHRFRIRRLGERTAVFAFLYTDIQPQEGVIRSIPDSAREAEGAGRR